MDLRWYNLHDGEGFWGLKKGVVMRVKDNPDLKVDWEPFEAVDRNRLQATTINSEKVKACCEVKHHFSIFDKLLVV